MKTIPKQKIIVAVILTALFGVSLGLNAKIETKAKAPIEKIVINTALDEGIEKAEEIKTLGVLRTQEIKQSLTQRSVGFLGILAIFFCAVVFSTRRSAISWRLVIFGTLSQFILALIVLKTDAGMIIFDGANHLVSKILGFSNAGARFVFGNLTDSNVPVGIAKGSPEQMVPLTLNGTWANTGAFFAFSVLPTIVFFSAMTAVLYYFGILQFVVRGIARVMQFTLRTSGAESFSAAANIFIGQSEAPLLVRPFLATMTKSEIMAIMTGGFATVSGGVLAAFVGMLSADFPDIAGHLLAASVMSAPASLVFAKIMLPETETPKTLSAKDIKVEIEDRNVFDACSRGTSDGLYLALNVGAMLIAFVAIIAFGDWIISSFAQLFGASGITLDKIFGFLFAPFAFLLGVPWEDATVIGNLLGMKTAINEFVAYLKLADFLEVGEIKNPKSVVIAIYALCGFANLSSIGIQIGGLSALAPSRRHDFAQIGFRAMIAGTLACMQTAAIAGILI